MANIQWYPGHMAKAKRQMIEKLKLVDVVIELADCRIPLSSRNPLADEIAAGKPRLLVLNKMDMADPASTVMWKQYYEAQGVPVHLVNSRTGAGTGSIAASVHRLTMPRREKMTAKGFRPHADRALIMGIPNVGKSTLINRLAGKKIAKIGDRPGVTTAQQWIKVGKTMELLDTPGILWPKFDNRDVGLKLAATGAIKEVLVDFQDIAFFLLGIMMKRYPESLSERYGLTDLAEVRAGKSERDAITQLLIAIGKRRGCLVAGGQVDCDRTAELIVRDYRTRKLGDLTLELPPNYK